MNRFLISFFLFIIPSLTLSKMYDLSFEKLKAIARLEFTRGPYVLMESIATIKFFDIKTKKQIHFPEDKNSVVIKLESQDFDVLAPKPEIHLNYQDKLSRIASRFFFTSGGKWKIRVVIKDGHLLSEEKSITLDIENKNIFPKDLKSFPYVGEIAHRKVGLLGGTGCRRRWDFVDTHDSLHMNMPYDLCGKYALVSNRYHKWVDLSIDGDKVEKLQLTPIKGDAALEKISCSKGNDIYQLVHYPVCGEPGKVIAYCNKAGDKIDAKKEGCLVE